MTAVIASLLKYESFLNVAGLRGIAHFARKEVENIKYRSGGICEPSDSISKIGTFYPNIHTPERPPSIPKVDPDCIKGLGGCSRGAREERDFDTSVSAKTVKLLEFDSKIVSPVFDKMNFIHGENAKPLTKGDVQEERAKSRGEDHLWCYIHQPMNAGSYLTPDAGIARIVFVDVYS